MKRHAERPIEQGGGKYTRPSPALRRARNRKRNRVARKARRLNRLAIAKLLLTQQAGRWWPHKNPAQLCD